MTTHPIMLVEDNPDDRDLTLLAFQQAGVAGGINVCGDGEEALDFLLAAGRFSERDPSVMPRIILLDLQLPKIDGLEVLRRIRANDATRLLPVVILTSSREERDLARGYGLGANSYIRKPVNFNAFVDASRTIAGYWLTLNEAPPAYAA